MAGPVVVVDAFDQEVGVPGDEGEVEGGHFEGKAGAFGGAVSWRIRDRDWGVDCGWAMDWAREMRNENEEVVIGPWEG